MDRSDLTKEGIANNDFLDVTCGRYAANDLDPDYKVSREEIIEIIREASIATPSGVDLQPWHLLIVDTDEGKQKLDDIMRAGDKDRVTRCSFAIVPLGDRQFMNNFDELWDHIRATDARFNEESMSNFMIKEAYAWYEEMCEGDVKYLERSVSFQTGMLMMSIMFACRAHGIDSGFMDSWDPDLLEDYFGIDMERYGAYGVLACGKSNIEDKQGKWRFEAESVVEWD